MACEHCNNIKTYDEVKKDVDWFTDHSQIVHEQFDGGYGYYVDVDDPYYSGVYMHGMKFCPFCGRRLCEKSGTVDADALVGGLKWLISMLQIESDMINDSDSSDNFKTGYVNGIREGIDGIEEMIRQFTTDGGDKQ